MEFALLGVLIGVSTIFSIYAQFKITQIASSQLAQRVAALDEALGTAIEQILSGGINGIEPVNPILGMIAEVFKEKAMQSPIDARVIHQDAEGKFTSLEKSE